MYTGFWGKGYEKLEIGPWVTDLLACLTLNLQGLDKGFRFFDRYPILGSIFHDDGWNSYRNKC